MKSTMLGEIKPEIKPEAAKAEPDPLDKQLKAFQQRLQSQTVLPPPKPSSNNENNTEKTDEEPPINFGWEEIEKGLHLPYVNRGSKEYVANHIVAELVYKRIQMDFSNEMLVCMAIIMERMSQKEADTFNEINIKHCDRNIVGNYCFKANEYMINLEHVKTLVAFYNACRNLVINKIKENNLFGFIQIAGESRVPFIWNGDQKLVPLFYFEGQSEYLDARSIDLTEPFKIGYIKFCCKVQKINKCFYEQNPLKVVDFEDVKKLFHAGITTFEVNLPEKVNQQLMSPERRIAYLHEIEERETVPQSHPATVSLHSNSPEQELNNIADASLCSGQESSLNNSPQGTVPRSPILENQPLDNNDQIEDTQRGKEDDSELANKTLATELSKYKDHMRLNRNKAKRAQKRPAPTVKVSGAKVLKLAVATPVAQSKTQEDRSESYRLTATCETLLPQPPKPQTTNQIENIQNFSRISTITPVHHEGSNRQQNITKRMSELAERPPITAPPKTFTKSNKDMYTPGPTSNHQISNVPYRSPRSASSPGFPQPSTIINEAAERVPAYSQTTITPVTDITRKPTQQTTVATGPYQPALSHLYQMNMTNHGSQQYNTVLHHPQGQQFVNGHQQNCVPHPVKNRSINPTSNTSVPSIPYYSQNGTAQGTYSQVPTYSHAPMQFQDWRSNQHFLDSRIRREQQTCHGSQQQMLQSNYYQQNSSFPSHPTMSITAQNFQRYPVPIFTGHQSISGSYSQQTGNLPTPVIQNVNISTVNYAISQNYLPSSSMPETTGMFNRSTNSFPSQDINNSARNLSVKLKTTVVDHPPYFDPNPELYKTKNCAINGKLLLGISNSTIAHSFLVNLSEFVEKVLGLNPFVNQTEIPSRFKSLYKLNPVQKVQWDRVAREKQLQLVGPFKDVFVEDSELVALYYENVF